MEFIVLLASIITLAICVIKLIGKLLDKKVTEFANNIHLQSENYRDRYWMYLGRKIGLISNADIDKEIERNKEIEWNKYQAARAFAEKDSLGNFLSVSHGEALYIQSLIRKYNPKIKCTRVELFLAHYYYFNGFKVDKRELIQIIKSVECDNDNNIFCIFRGEKELYKVLFDFEVEEFFSNLREKGEDATAKKYSDSFEFAVRMDCYTKVFLYNLRRL